MQTQWKFWLIKKNKIIILYIYIYRCDMSVLKWVENCFKKVVLHYAITALFLSCFNKIQKHNENYLLI